MDNLVEEASRQEDLLSIDALRFAAQVTGGPRFLFLWRAGSGQDLLPSQEDVISGLGPVSTSLPGRNIELDAKLFKEAAERWRKIHRPKTPKERRTPLGRRLDEIREGVKVSGQPLLSWEEIDREIAERRGE